MGAVCLSKNFHVRPGCRQAWNSGLGGSKGQDLILTIQFGVRGASKSLSDGPAFFGVTFDEKLCCSLLGFPSVPRCPLSGHAPTSANQSVSVE